MQGLNFEDRFICDPRIVAILAGVPQKYPLGTLTMDGADWPIQLPLVHRHSLDDACKQLGFMGNCTGLETPYGYCKRVLKMAADKGKVLALLPYFFSFERFIASAPFADLQSPQYLTQSKRVYQEVCERVLKAINAILYLYDRSLQAQASDGGFQSFQWIVVSQRYGVDPIVYPSGPIDRSIRRGQQALIHGDYDTVLTQARTLLESVLKQILSKTCPPKEFERMASEPLPKLYRAFVRCHKALHAAPDLSERFYRLSDSLTNSICQMLAFTVRGVGSLRNHAGDAHGKTDELAKTFQLESYHAQFVLNVALTLTHFFQQAFGLTQTHEHEVLIGDKQQGSGS